VKLTGNTVGRLIKPYVKVTDVELAYIAGFLDGDGSVMVQVKKTKFNPKGWRLMFTICFYQDSKHAQPLSWIKKKLQIGYLSYRNDGITEFRINGYAQTENILKELFPYLHFKKKQVVIILKILKLVHNKKLGQLNREERLKIADLIYQSRLLTYKSGWKNLSKTKQLREIIGY
jgi:hypothetical protein